ncbi:transglutaminase family protein [Actomonas aquatica]|uniref:Transglutaminase family protein n=1 Tax=Actomonas aquatica TaxID=2866162 RepID=A0ABZ1CE33_9BACT|nr:transglutaminase family protein [Opitutus sp. WL0086]WRQ88545.1 transglutaminase family protein [Opitutus sp. WL0086]
MILRITHETRYRYAEPVSLSGHLLYLRPRENSRQRLHHFDLSISPDPILSRVEDPLDNERWTIRFPENTDHLDLVSTAVVETLESNPFNFVLDPSAIESPFEYAPELKFALGPYLAPPFDDTQRALQAWLDQNFAERPRNTVEMLTAFSQLIYERLTYVRREERGIQPSLTTLELGGGACRDFAVLFTELCRTLGLAARFVSGYMHAPDGDDHRTIGAMHAWAEVYLPGAGWKAIDPTHGIWCDDRFVPVAHGAQAEVVNPVQGDYFAPHPVASSLEVSVIVEPTELPASSQQQQQS